LNALPGRLEEDDDDDGGGMGAGATEADDKID